MTLRPEFLSQLWRRKLATRRKAAGRGGGIRASTSLGDGMDFGDFRPYAEGASTRHIDPNLYARLGKLFVRQYVEERPLEIAIVLDCSASMMVPDSAKFDHAQSLVEAFAALALAGGDRLRLYCGGVASKVFSGKANFAAVTQWLQNQMHPQTMQWRRLAQQSSRSALVIVISDFLYEEPAQILAPFAVKGAELWTMQVLTPSEDSLDGFAFGEVTVEDVETGTELALAITPELVDQYRRLVSTHRQQLATRIRARGGQFHCLRSDQNIERLVLKLSTAV